MHVLEDSLASFAGNKNESNILKPRENGCYYADDIFKRIFLKENIWIWIKIWQGCN